MNEISSSLASIDYIIIFTYMVGVLAIGAYFAKYVHSSGDFFLAGRALPFWAIGMSIVVSDIGAIDMILGAGGAYQYGLAQANFDWIGSVPAVIVAAFLFMPYYWRAGVYTVPEFLGRRYNGMVRWIQALMLLAFLAVNVSIMLYASAVFLQSVLGWNLMLGIWVTAIAVGVYTVTGGLAAVVMTDVLQMVIMFIGAGSLVALSLYQVGGWDGMTATILAESPQNADFFKLLLPHSADTPYPWTGIVFSLGLIMSTAYFVGNQAVLQRVLGARSEWDAKAGMVLAGFFKLMIPLLVFVPGLAARALYPGLENPDSAVPQMVATLLPAGIKGLMFAAFFAALMSSVDSYLNSSVTIFVSDIYKSTHELITRRPMPDRLGLLLGRVLTVVLLFSAAFFAPTLQRFPTLYTFVQTLLSLFQGPTLAVLLLGIFWRRATGVGALVGLVSGVCSTAIMNSLGSQVFPSDDPFLFVSFWSFVLSLVVTVIVSLLTPQEPAEKLRGLVYGEVVGDPATQAALERRMEGLE